LADLSLAGRILAAFAEHLPEGVVVPDALAELGELAQHPAANIIKLPNISASVPQLRAAIAELRTQGFDLPDYPEDAVTDADKDARARYDRVKGSAVNPVLRQGNSDRRAPAAVKAYVRQHPHAMGLWSPDSATRVATMSEGDFYHNEASTVAPADDHLEIRFTPTGGASEVLGRFSVLAGEVVDATKMSARALDAFLVEQVAAARDEGLLFGQHLKATMMKVSDPVLFGHVLRAVLPGVFAEQADALRSLGVCANDGLGPLLAASDPRTEPGRAVREAVAAGLAEAPDLLMVDAGRGISCLHVPSDVIIDASLPAIIRAGGKAWGPDGTEGDTLVVIPDSTYAPIYQAVLDDCRAHGAVDPVTAGTVPNVGLMAQAAEEYGSHDKTFVLPAAGVVEVVSLSVGAVLFSHEVEAGDIWRACQTKDAAIRDWVSLAVRRARLSGMPAVFWLDHGRAHDHHLLGKLEHYLALEDTDGLEIHVMDPAEACRFTLARLRAGLDTISVTGNVLRDYLTDLFPILEVGTSAKMLSIVPLMAGGGLFETGAGGSAPKHVSQFLEEGYLRWDSLGEFFALAASLEHLGQTTGSAEATVMSQALDRATERFLVEDRSPGRHLGTPDNRGSHFWLALYWACELAAQTDLPELAAVFAPVADRLEAGAEQASAELLAAQGQPVELSGYYRPDPALVAAAMRPSQTFNRVLAALG
ncbi:MAG: NADP-dependent isocitrate dehydrogenase, partial [Promicromonosporaceae bacterium]|nr:NADP-dependent isocitrate dehydrogenase [Promicromonosporaceae bacterium]